MFYEELYKELGKLFYHIAAADGKVAASEKETLQQLVETNWKPLESSADRFGTDRAYLISFAFDYEEAEGGAENGYESFEKFYRENESAFTPVIISNILQTGKAIASVYRSKNKSEQEVLNKINNLFQR